MHRRLAAGASAFLLLLVPAAPLSATTFAPRSTGDLVLDAERVCCVRCEGCEPRIDPRSGIVFTHVRLGVLEDLKGRSPASTIELRIVGGRVGSVETVVPGMPRFVPGGEAVVLLGPSNRAGYPVVVQARRGVLPLARAEDGRRVVRASVSGLGDLPEDRHVSLDAFRGAVRAHVERARREVAEGAEEDR